MEKRIEKAIDIFLDALNEGTLAKGSCIACAVGNLVAAGLDAKITYSNNGFKCNKNNFMWGLYFNTSNNNQVIYESEKHHISVISNIEATDFTAEELMKIEYAFETNTYILYIDYNEYSKKEIMEDQIKGLKAVVDVMLTFNNDTTTNVDAVFTNKAKKLIPNEII